MSHGRTIHFIRRLRVNCLRYTAPNEWKVGQMEAGFGDRGSSERSGERKPDSSIHGTE